MILRRVVAAAAASLMACGVVTGALVESAPSVGAAGGPTAYTIQFFVGQGCQLATVDLSTGAVTALPTAASRGACVGDLTETADGHVYGVATVGGRALTVHLIQFDTATGLPTDLGPIGASTASLGTIPAYPAYGGITFDATGRLFVSMIGGDDACKNGKSSGDAFCLYQVDPANPLSATFKGLGTLTTNEQALTASCDGRMMTLADADPGFNPLQFGGAAASQATDTTTSTTSGDGVAPQGDVTAQVLALGANAILNLRDPSNGAMTPIGTGVGTDSELTGLEFDSSGKLWAIGSQFGDPTVNRIFTVDPTTGVATAGPALSGDAGGLPAGLALALTCPVALQVAPTFTG